MHEKANVRFESVWFRELSKHIMGHKSTDSTFRTLCAKKTETSQLCDIAVDVPNEGNWEEKKNHNSTHKNWWSYQKAAVMEFEAVQKNSFSIETFSCMYHLIILIFQFFFLQKPLFSFFHPIMSRLFKQRCFDSIERHAKDVSSRLAIFIGVDIATTFPEPSILILFSLIRE